MHARRKPLGLLLCLIALWNFSCSAANSQQPSELQQVGKVILLKQNNNDPRPFFRANMNFTRELKLTSKPEELLKQIEIREVDSLFNRTKSKAINPFYALAGSGDANRDGLGNLDVILLFDVSGSMLTGKLGDQIYLDAAKEAANGLLENFLPGDRLAIVPFEGRGVMDSVQKTPFAATREDAQTQIQKLQADRNGNTALYTATILAVERLRQERKESGSRQQALIILTDGENDVKDKDEPAVVKRRETDTLEKVKREIHDSQILTYAIGVGPDADEKSLREMVGAQYFGVSDLTGLRNTLKSLRKTLRNQLTVSFFTQRQDRKFRKLTFEVTVKPSEEAPIQGILNMNCRSTSGCVAEESLNDKEQRPLINRQDLPALPGSIPKQIGMLFLVAGMFSAGLAGLWIFIPRVFWPGPSLPPLPRRGAQKPSLPRASSGRGNAAPEAPVAAKPRQRFEETKIYDDKSRR